MLRRSRHWLRLCHIGERRFHAGFDLVLLLLMMMMGLHLLPALDLRPEELRPLNAESLDDGAGRRLRRKDRVEVPHRLRGVEVWRFRIA